MKKRVVFLSFVLLSALSVSSRAQTPQGTPLDQRQESIRQINEQRVREAQRQERQREFERLRSLSSENSVKIIKRESLLPLTVKPNREQKKLLQPDSVDVARFANFLKQPNTGLIKLFPDAGCQENARIVRADDNCLNSIPNGAFYSFRRREHIAEVLLDIRYKNGFLISDGLFSQGILVALGNVPLENVLPQDEAMSFLTAYKPEIESGEILKQFAKITKGVKIGRYQYKNTAPAFENMTYGLRVVAYRGKVFQSFRGRIFDVLDGDKRVDLMLAFRIVRRDEDGSLTLLWKELERRVSPKVLFPKRKKQN